MTGNAEDGDRECAGTPPVIFSYANSWEWTAKADASPAIASSAAKLREITLNINASPRCAKATYAVAESSSGKTYHARVAKIPGQRISCRSAMAAASLLIEDSSPG